MSISIPILSYYLLYIIYIDIYSIAMGGPPASRNPSSQPRSVEQLSNRNWAMPGCTANCPHGPPGAMAMAATQWPFQDPKMEIPTIYKAYIRAM